MAVLSLWPVQNGPSLGGGIGISYNNPLQRIREDFGTTRADYNFSDKDTFFGVYTIDDSSANTPTVLNTARFGFSRAGSTPSPTAGVITATASTSRQIQLGLKLLF